MRIYISEPNLFAKHADKFVTLVLDPSGHQGEYSVIRNQTGDYKRVKTNTLDFEFQEPELLQELVGNTRLREVALEDGLIEVGDYHYADDSYLNYVGSY